MSRKKKKHYHYIGEWLKMYATPRFIDLRHPSPYHYMLTDGTSNKIHIWTTGRYYIESSEDERDHKKGIIPLGKNKHRYLCNFLDRLFYPGEDVDEIYNAMKKC